MALFESLQALVAHYLPFLALDERQLIFAIATPVFLGLTAFEYRKIRHDPTLTNLKEVKLNFLLGFGYQLTELLFAGILAFPVYDFAYAHRFFTLELDFRVAIATFLALDFAYYWFHRASHRIRWFWCAHVAHHSSERMNLSTAMRQNATNVFNGGWLFYASLCFFGFRPSWVGVAYALSLVYQFFIHTQLVGKMWKPIELVFNTPSHHRAHHGRNPRYIDTNYAGVLIVWDRLFGTFVEESADDPVEYGITRQIKSDSLVTNTVHEYVDMAHDMAKPGPIVDRLKHLVMPPEWTRESAPRPADA